MTQEELDERAMLRDLLTHDGWKIVLRMVSEKTTEASEKIKFEMIHNPEYVHKNITPKIALTAHILDDLIQEVSRKAGVPQSERTGKWAVKT